jgi:Carboxypeptidase regulatory-like domain
MLQLFLRLLLAGMFLAAAGLSLAQLGSVQGCVFDRNERPILKAKVAITDSLQGFTDSVSTGTDGCFRIDTVYPGTYLLRVSRMGYTEFVQNGVRVDARKITFMDPQLTPIGWKPPKEKKRHRKRR